MEAIKISCKASKTIPLNDLIPLEGDLKSLSKEDFQKLRASIIRYGISYPFFVWPNGGKAYLLDGHQRDRVLREMRDEGFTVPRLPVDFIEAKDEKEAKEKILLLSSQYGKMTESSLIEFIESGDLELGNLKEIIDFPEVNLDSIEGVNIGDQSEELTPIYEVMVTCKSELDQLNIMAKLEGRGYKCKAWDI